MELKVIVSDIETLKEMFLCTCLDPIRNEWVEFEVSEEKNNIDAMVDYFLSHEEHYFVFYNGIRFDSQVLEYIIRNSREWHELSRQEIVDLIYQCAQDTIENANYGLFPMYNERELSFKIIDVFTINHFDNKNRMVSLKRLQFEMDYENIEEMPINHAATGLSSEDLDTIRTYCRNDVASTYEFYKITIGQTDHPLYRGNDQIELRMRIQEQFDIPCLNYSDSKIGDEIIKSLYSKALDTHRNQLPKKGTFRKKIRLQDCISKNIKFKTKQLKDFLSDLKKTELGIKDDFKSSIRFYDNTYSFMMGGIHTENKPEMFEAEEDEYIIDYDVSSYYPATIINNGKYPAHLGKDFLKGYKKIYEERLKLKPLAKTDDKIRGIVGAYKLSLNSVYGKSSDMTNWMYDRLLTMFTTITGQLSLMMLAEMYELEGIHVISANTDGLTVHIKKDLFPKVEEINEKWCKITKYELERTDYAKIIFLNVNHYLAILTNGKVKKKGSFLTDYELHKNKSAKIVAIALERWYVDNIPVDQTIKNHSNIYDFCIRQKATRDFHYEGVRNGTKEVTVYDKLIRYYVSTDGETILKIKNPECQTNAAKVSHIEAGGWLCTVCNYLPKTVKVEHCNIDYRYYIERAENIIRSILVGKKVKQTIIPNQTQLW